MFKKWEGTSWEMSPGMGNFMAGGLASNMYWLTALRESAISNVANDSAG
jgi:solute carrier family 25 carnitine/acylcarnitine transporter 20/29